jgi:hypothetical protein
MIQSWFDTDLVRITRGMTPSVRSRRLPRGGSLVADHSCPKCLAAHRQPRQAFVGYLKGSRRPADRCPGGVPRAPPVTERFFTLVETALTAENAEDERVQPAANLIRDTAELDLELEGLALGGVGEGGEHLRERPPLGELVARLAPGEAGTGEPPASRSARRKPVPKVSRSEGAIVRATGTKRGRGSEHTRAPPAHSCRASRSGSRADPRIRRAGPAWGAPARAAARPGRRVRLRGPSTGVARRGTRSWRWRPTSVPDGSVRPAV